MKEDNFLWFLVGVIAGVIFCAILLQFSHNADLQYRSYRTLRDRCENDMKEIRFNSEWEVLECR